LQLCHDYQAWSYALRRSDIKQLQAAVRDASHTQTPATLQRQG
jgi:hypothetical protein